MSSETVKKCSVRDGNFVEPCSALENLLEVNTSSKRTGIVTINLFNRHVGNWSRSFIVAKSGKYKQGGFCFRYCPVCGEDISAPFDKEDAPPRASDAPGEETA